jgi:hypothetical protein
MNEDTMTSIVSYCYSCVFFGTSWGWLVVMVGVCVCVGLSLSLSLSLSLGFFPLEGGLPIFFSLNVN